MGDYSWYTFSEANDLAKNFGRGLRSIGHQPKENIIIFSETRAEWFISAMGAFKQSIPVCTLYATLGEDALILGINETEVIYNFQSGLKKFILNVVRMENI